MDKLIPRIKYHRRVVLHNFEKTHLYDVRMTRTALDKFMKEKAHEVDCIYRQTNWRYGENTRWWKAQTEIKNRAWTVDQILEIKKKYRTNEKTRFKIV